LSLFALGLWAAICVRDPNYPGCALRPGQCIEVAELDGVQLCEMRPPPPKTGQKK
jgi:hypothetical protein